MLIDMTKENLKTGWYISREHTNKRKTRAKCWNTIHEIVDVDTDSKVDCVFLCTLCNDVIYNGSKDGNTMAFNRHTCFAKDEEKTNRKRLLISKEEKEKLVAASAMFVAKDFRPISAVEGDGLKDLCLASMQFGQKYPKATAKDMEENWPTRHRVLSYMETIASKVENDIGEIMKMAKSQNGLAATTDCWTDNYRRLAYMCITIHATLIEANQIKNYRALMSMECITELVKTKKVIIDAILDSFASYDYSAEDVKKHVTFVSDRGPNIRYGLQDGGFNMLHCYDHMFDNHTGRMLKLPDLQMILNNCNQLCSYMKNTGLNSRLKITLKTWSKSRWIRCSQPILI